MVIGAGCVLRWQLWGGCSSLHGRLWEAIKVVFYSGVNGASPDVWAGTFRVLSCTIWPLCNCCREYGQAHASHSHRSPRSLTPASHSCLSLLLTTVPSACVPQGIIRASTPLDHRLVCPSFCPGQTGTYDTEYFTTT